MIAPVESRTAKGLVGTASINQNSSPVCSLIRPNSTKTFSIKCCGVPVTGTASSFQGGEDSQLTPTHFFHLKYVSVAVDGPFGDFCSTSTLNVVASSTFLPVCPVYAPLIVSVSDPGLDRWFTVNVIVAWISTMYSGFSTLMPSSPPAILMPPSETVRPGPSTTIPPLTSAPPKIVAPPATTVSPASVTLIPPLTTKPPSSICAPPEVIVSPTSSIIMPPVTVMPPSTSMPPSAMVRPTSLIVIPPVTSSPPAAMLTPPASTVSPVSTTVTPPEILAPSCCTSRPPVTTSTAATQGVYTQKEPAC